MTKKLFVQKQVSKTLFIVNNIKFYSLVHDKNLFWSEELKLYIPKNYIGHL